MKEDGDFGGDTDLKPYVSAEEKMETGATKSFKMYMESSYARLGSMARAMNKISGGTMGEYVNTVQGMMLQHQQRERNESRETLAVWFRISHPEDNRQRVKAELSTRVQTATGGKLMDPTTYQVGWTTINLEGT